MEAKRFYILIICALVSMMIIFYDIATDRYVIFTNNFAKSHNFDKKDTLINSLNCSKFSYFPIAITDYDEYKNTAIFKNSSLRELSPIEACFVIAVTTNSKDRNLHPQFKAKVISDKLDKLRRILLGVNTLIIVNLDSTIDFYNSKVTDVNRYLSTERNEMIAQLNFINSTFCQDHDIIMSYSTATNFKKPVIDKKRNNFVYFCGDLPALNSNISVNETDKSVVDNLNKERTLIELLTQWQNDDRKHSFDMQFSCKRNTLYQHLLEWDVCENELTRLGALENATFSMILSPLDDTIISSTLVQLRVYESLKAGTIPVILGTNILLPYNEIIQWERISIRFSKDKFNQMKHTLQRLSSKEISTYQMHIKRIFELYLSSTEQNLQAILAVLRRRQSISIPVAYNRVPTVVFVSNIVIQNISQNATKNKNVTDINLYTQNVSMTVWNTSSGKILTFSSLRKIEESSLNCTTLRDFNFLSALNSK